MLKSIRNFMLALSVAATAFAIPAQALSPEQKKEFEEVIREYILKNPELIQETLVELDRRHKEAEVEARRKITTDKSGPLFASRHHVTFGNPKGDVTIVEFYDYNCGFCKRGLADLQKLVGEDKNVRVILKEFPVLSQGSRDAAEVAYAVKLQTTPEKYWEYHSKLMLTKGQIGRAQAIEVAKDVGLDAAKIEQDMAKPDASEALLETRKIADGLGITGTPTYVIGDDVVVGAVGYDVLRNRVKNFRLCGKSRCGA